MEKNKREEQSAGNDGRTFWRGQNWWMLAAVLVVLSFLILANYGRSRSQISYKQFLAEIEHKVPKRDATGKPLLDKNGDQIPVSNVAQVELGDTEAQGVFRVAPRIKRELNAKDELVDKKGVLEKRFRVTLSPSGEERAELEKLLQAEQVEYEHVKPDNTYAILLFVACLLPLVILGLVWFSARRRREDIMGGSFLSGFSKSPAKRYEATRQPTTFKDVAGLEGTKADLLEIVEYLKSPDKFRRLGGRIPKGVLLNGPPGTGKTLLARAVAGEAGVPFFSVSGSEFIQMFVGVGASRVRDLFKTAKDASPAIVFIDEIDAVGRQRGAGVGGGHDEREQTLNQILSEMDGFTPNEAVIVLAATNRPDVLDPALLRPGRFDRHVTVDRPSMRGRIEIFKVHVRDVPLADDVDLERLAASAVGLTGADIRNLVNEAALWAARKDKSKVSMSDFNYAFDKVLIGAKREEVLNDKEKKATAFHEAGHTLLAWMLPGCDRVNKVTVIPRGRALGVTHTLPTEDRLSIAEGELRDRLVMLLGGRAAEELVYRHTNIGAENDLERATALARRMVTHWGMTERLGPVSYKSSEEDPFLGREIHQQRKFSEHTMELIDEEVARILHESAERAEKMLRENRDKLDQLADALFKQEELSEAQITELIGPSVQHSRASNNGKVYAPGDNPV